jgi:outer membrane biosynthesis protein TonB
MTATEPIRSEQIESRNRLLIGLATSLATHMVLFGVWFLLGVLVVAAHLASIEKLKQLQLAELKRAQEVPELTFVEVTPDQASPEPPKDTKFYSSANAQAANPDVEIDTNVPKIDGSQDKVLKTADALRPQAQPLQPSPPPEPKPEEKAAKDESKPDPTQNPGDLALAKPQEQEPPKRERPRKLADVKPQETAMAGKKMKQEGGIKRVHLVASLDVKATPFGAYDAAIIAAIQKRWYDLLDQSTFPPRTGRVVIEFRLYSDGRITDLKVTEEDVGDILTVYCRRAISDPAPYGPWPSDMRRMIGKEYRDVKFTFYYL